MGINISIVAGPDKISSSVVASGSIQHVVTDKEVNTFKIGDKQLKDAVEKYFGKRPKDAFPHSPTPWHDLYKTYNWEQVQTILAVKNAEIIEITSEPEIIKTQEFVNNSSKKASFNVSISDSVSNTVSSNWSTGGELSVGKDIECGVSFLGCGLKGNTSISYTQSWGIGETKSETVTVGSASGVNVELDPGEAVTAVLSASRGVMKVRVRYKAYLIGNTAVNYNPKYKDHHFWCLNINNVMKSDNICNSIESTEDMKIGYYSNSKVEIKDSRSNVIKTIALGNH